MGSRIQASWLLTLLYCEYKFYLQHVEQVEIPKTKAMEIGSIVHNSKEQDFLKEAKPISWKDFLDSETYAISKEVFLVAKFENNELVGKIDEIGIDKNGIYIIEDKPNAKPYKSARNQLYAYCYLFKRNFVGLCSKPIYAILRDRDSNEIVWKEYFGLEKEFELINNLNKIKKIMKKVIGPIPTTNPNKCTSCSMSMLKLCKHSLATN